MAIKNYYKIKSFRLPDRLSRRFLEIESLAFSEVWLDVKNLSEVVSDRVKYFENKMLYHKNGTFFK